MTEEYILKDLATIKEIINNRLKQRGMQLLKKNPCGIVIFIFSQNAKYSITFSYGIFSTEPIMEFLQTIQESVEMGQSLHIN